MPSGLAALLDDVATIAKLAAASVDDIGAAAGKASAKAAGVVIDDAAVTPRYVTGFTPQRELPIIWKIAKGSAKNKLLFILPAALLLSAFLPWAITPILMVGGAYLCFEGAEKLYEHFFHHDNASLEEEAEQLSAADHEAKMVAGAIRTDLILSAEIMAIALNEVADQNIWMQAGALIVVALAITAVVYGAVGLIVKMDDIGLHMAQKEGRGAKGFGHFLVKAMPKVLKALSIIGVAAMIWVGGGIILHGMHEFHITKLPEWLDSLSHSVAAGIGVAQGFIEWVVHAIGSGIFGVIIGGIIVAALHMLPKKKAA
ncbi:DUF808 domain-containing protein [Pseudonocardia sp. TMWB2A]|uniref:DUF808 domain-containing protein n=1 Tax=Pseudonocardia sp. TMWB2A TaxID=687430 RepID=UPI00307E0CA3